MRDKLLKELMLYDSAIEAGFNRAETHEIFIRAIMRICENESLPSLAHLERRRDCPECVQSNGQVCYNGQTLQECPKCQGTGKQVREVAFTDTEIIPIEILDTGRFYFILDLKPHLKDDGWDIYLKEGGR